MASASETLANVGIHQLDRNAYPPTESDDEDSFVVLDSDGPMTLQLAVEPISTASIENTLASISESLAKQSMSSSSGSIPKQVALEKKEDGLDKLTSYVSISGEEIQKNVDNLIAENMKLKDTLAQNNLTMKMQVEKITKWQEEVQQVQESHKRKFSDMKKIIQELKAENEKLKTDFRPSEEKDVEDVKTGTASKKIDNILQFELEAAQKKIKEMERALDIIITEKQNMSAEVSRYKRDMGLFEDEIQKLRQLNDKMVNDKSLRLLMENDLNNELKIVKEECIALKETNNALNDEVKSLSEKYNSLKDIFVKNEANYNTAQSTLQTLQETLANAKEQLMASQMYITELKHSHLKDVQQKNDEITDLKNKLREQQIGDDELTALRAQLDIYKGDYETATALKDEILTEKNRMADELQLLQRRNEELIEEVDQFRSGFIPVQTEEVQNAPSSNCTYTCPRCFFRFKSMQALQNHVYRCIELDSLP